MSTRTDRSESAVANHLAFLRERIFQTETKWPHFTRLLDDVAALANGLPDSAEVVILERAYVYGGDSLFAPLFHKQHVTVVDCELPTTASRGGYQKSWTDDPRCLHIRADHRAPITKTGLASECADLLLVPNVVHHVADQEAMFAEIRRLLKPGGQGYIFEALLRELHQAPDDYVRYTPWGFETMLNHHELELTKWTPIGGPFEAIAYCWVQALQYFPDDKRTEREQWFYREHFPELMRLNAEHTQNQCRAHTTFPIAYSIYFRRPE